MMTRFDSVRARFAVHLRSDEGLTLLELLIVIAILSLLAVVGTVQLSGYLARAKVDTAKLQLDQLVTAIDLFRIDVGRAPNEAEGLKALIEAPADLPSWRGPYLRKREALNDPWGRPFVFRSPGAKGEYEIVTLGADGRPEGTAENGDIISASVQ